MFGMKYDFKHDRERRVGFDDMIFLSKTTENDINHNLQRRFNVDYIYTYIGPVLIAVNPYKDLPYLHENYVDRYRGSSLTDNAPHIFAIAEGMFSKMLTDYEKQCVIITGESGAGKTVSMKLILSYIMEVSHGRSNIQRIKEIILHSNPLLEAFGNAKTIRNNNSSRFGKYIEIQFSSGGEPLGGLISNFLLEKSRIVNQAMNERNFHIFYQLLSNREFLNRFDLLSTDFFHYLNPLFQSSDGEALAKTQYAMEIIGLSKDVQNHLFNLLIGILHLGNIQFDDRDNYASFRIDQNLFAPCRCFGIDESLLKKRLITKRLEFKEQKENRRIEQRFSFDKAIFTRDALAKGIYSRLFDYLIRTINTACETSTRCEISLGLLDIYGFEIFERNSFEQLCINYVNEKLQEVFLNLTIKEEQDEYLREGIRWSSISYSNNHHICELFDGKQPPGLFLLLDDICTSSHASSTNADRNYLDKLTQMKSSVLTVAFETFTVKHYAGPVNYQSEQICEKNRDLLSTDLIEMMQQSQISFVVRLFPEQISEIKSRPTTAGMKIRTQTNLLIEKLSTCQSHYIRCIKPNENQQANQWDSNSVNEQIKYLGLVANIQIRKAGFVYRRTFEKFLSRYAILTAETWPKWNGSLVNGVLHIINEMHLDQSEIRLGKTKLFIKSAESLHLLEDMRLRRFDHYARIIQRTLKRFCAASLSQRQREEATTLIFERKDRRANSINRTYLGDYCNIYQRADLQKLIDHHEKLQFSSFCFKYDRRFRRQNRYLIVTNFNLYIISEEHVKTSTNDFYTLNYEIRRKISLENLEKIRLSEFFDNFFLIDVKNDYSTLLELSTKTEAIYLIEKNYRQRTHQRLTLTFGQNFDYAVKKKNWTNSTSRSIKFIHAATAMLMRQFNPQKSKKTTDVHRDYEVKISNQTMTVMVNSGLSKTSLPVPQKTELILSKTNHRKTRIVSSNCLKLKALFDFQARTADEISFHTDDLLDLIDDHDSTWWRAASNGKIGMIPSNYVERLNDSL